MFTFLNARSVLRFYLLQNCTEQTSNIILNRANVNTPVVFSSDAKTLPTWEKVKTATGDVYHTVSFVATP